MNKALLKDISKEISSGLTPLRSNDEYWLNGNIPWLKTEQLGQYKITHTSEMVTQKATKETGLKIYPRNTISIAMYGEGKTRGNVSIIDAPMATNQACCNLIVNDCIVEPYYLYYFLKTQYSNLRKLSSGVRKNLNTNDIKNYVITFPNKKEQKNIINILSSIDNKIELNNKINTELEKIAKDLYNYWFVQFDFPDENGHPYKSNDGKMIYNGILKREIPVGWEVKQIRDILEEQEKSSVQVNQADILGVYPFFTSGNDVLRYNKYFVDGMYCYLSTGGNACVKYYLGKASYSTDTWCISANEYSFYLYNYLYSIKNQIDMLYFAGTGLKHLQKDIFKNSYIIIPPYHYIEKYNNIVFNGYKICSRYYIENQELTKLRDFLLPMLMNGQATIANSQEDNLSEEKIIKKSLEFWQTHGKMDIDRFARENGILVYKDNEQKKGAVSYNAEKDLYEIAIKDPRDNFTIAHEIGHILKHKNELKSGTLGRKSDESGTKIMEQEADSLAAEILMPEEYVLRYMHDKNKTEKDYLDEKFIKECAKYFNVNPPAINIRLKNLSYKVPYIR